MQTGWVTLSECLLSLCSLPVWKYLCHDPLSSQVSTQAFSFLRARMFILKITLRVTSGFRNLLRARVKVKEPDFTCWPHSLGAPQLDHKMG